MQSQLPYANNYHETRLKDNNKIKKKINDDRIFLTSVLHNQGQNKNFSACIAYANGKIKKWCLHSLCK